VVTKVTLLRSTSGSDEVYRLGEFTSYHDAEQMVTACPAAAFRPNGFILWAPGRTASNKVRDV
jgi:hypothetical protein